MMYDPAIKPDAEEWLALDDADRISLVLQYHKTNRIKVPKKKAHASIHAIVENQLAEGITAIVDTLDRLMSEGLDRHEAIHAIGSVLADYIYRLVRKEITGENAQEVYFSDVAQLSAKAWLSESDR
jgi:hypothetical protein